MLNIADKIFTHYILQNILVTEAHSKSSFCTYHGHILIYVSQYIIIIDTYKTLL